MKRYASLIYRMALALHEVLNNNVSMYVIMTNQGLDAHRAKFPTL